MTPETMRDALDKAVDDFKSLVKENGDRMVSDMGESFIQQSKEDVEAKLKYKFTVSVTLTPEANVMMVRTKITNGLKRTATADSVAG
jgi:hypothetical protein